MIRGNTHVLFPAIFVGWIERNAGRAWFICFSEAPPGQRS
jgi:hypothetical protein